MNQFAKVPQTSPLWVHRRQSPSYYTTSDTGYAHTLYTLEQDLSKKRHLTSRSALDIAVDFYTLFEKWQEETRFISSTEDMVLNMNYQSIIGLGPQVLPVIFKELNQGPQHLYWALQAITGQDPVRPENRGSLEAMNKDWLDWAIVKGYLDVVLC